MSLTELTDENTAFKKVLEQYNTAATKFIQKVDSGRARSTETYNELSLALLAANQLLLPLQSRKLKRNS